MLVAHRGFRTKQGENRLVDFESALKYAKGVEFDIRLTKDKQVIIFHDHNFKRIGKVDGRVRNFTYEEIKNIAYFKKHREWLPPLLSEFRLLLGHKYAFINIEIKPDYYTKKDYAIIFNEIELFKDLKAQIVVSSFSKKDQNEILKIDKRFKTGYLFWGMKNIDVNLAKKFDYLHPWVKNINSAKNIKFFKNLKMKMNVWTYVDIKDYDFSKKTYGDLIYGYIFDWNEQIALKNFDEKQ